MGGLLNDDVEAERANDSKRQRRAQAAAPRVTRDADRLGRGSDCANDGTRRAPAADFDARAEK